LIPSEELTALLIDTLGNDPFGDKTPLMVETTHSLDGETHTRIVSPKFETSAGEGRTPLSWGGLDARITANSNFSKVKARVVIGGLSKSGSDEDQFRIGRATLKSDIMKARGHEHLFVGTSSLALDKFLFMGTDKNTGGIHGFALESPRGQTSTAIRNGAKLTLDIIERNVKASIPIMHWFSGTSIVIEGIAKIKGLSVETVSKAMADNLKVLTQERRTLTDTRFQV
jgi:hypothetical protein